MEVITWKLLLGSTALTRSPEQLNVLELVRELKEKNMEMIVNIAVTPESLKVIRHLGSRHLNWLP